MPINLKNSTSVLPWARYSPQANMLTVAGETAPREMAFVGKSFAIDIENGTRGWLLITEGMRDVKYVPDRRSPADAPRSWLKVGVSVLLYAPKQFAKRGSASKCAPTRVRFLASQSDFSMSASRQFGNGEVPIVKITEAESIKIGKGKSRELQFRDRQDGPASASVR